MPHTKDGVPVAVGDVFNVPVKVVTVQTGDEYCNVNVQTVEPMFPGNDYNQFTLNAKQLVAQQVTHGAPAGVTDPMAQGQAIDSAGHPANIKAALQKGFGIMDIKSYAQHGLAVLQKAGDAAIGVLEAGFKMYSAFTDRDLTGILTAFKEGGDRVNAVINAIKEEFQLE